MKVEDRELCRSRRGHADGLETVLELLTLPSSQHVVCRSPYADDVERVGPQRTVMPQFAKTRGAAGSDDHFVGTVVSRYQLTQVTCELRDQQDSHSAASEDEKSGEESNLDVGDRYRKGSGSGPIATDSRPTTDVVRPTGHHDRMSSAYPPPTNPWREMPDRDRYGDDDLIGGRCQLLGGHTRGAHPSARRTACHLARRCGTGRLAPAHFPCNIKRAEETGLGGGWRRKPCLDGGDPPELPVG